MLSYRDGHSRQCSPDVGWRKAVSGLNPLDLLAIVGTMRSGSTPLDVLLGDNPAAMPRSTKLLIGAAMSPLLLKYGYSLSGPPGRARR